MFNWSWSRQVRHIYTVQHYMPTDLCALLSNSSRMGIDRRRLAREKKNVDITHESWPARTASGENTLGYCCTPATNPIGSSRAKKGTGQLGDNT